MTDVLNIERTYSVDQTTPAFAVVGNWKASTGEAIAVTPGNAYGSKKVTPDAMFLIEKSYDFDKWQQKLDRMSGLHSGWNGYEAPVPSSTAIATARGFLAHLLKEKYEPSRVAPSAEGGVGLAHKSGNRRVYVEFFNDGAVYALFSDSETPPSSRRINVGFQEFRDLVVQIKDYLDA